MFVWETDGAPDSSSAYICSHLHMKNSTLCMLALSWLEFTNQTYLKVRSKVDSNTTNDSEYLAYLK